MAVASPTRDSATSGPIESSTVDGRSAVWIGVLVFFLFTGLYFAMGSRLAQLPIYLTSNNIFFGADYLEAVKGWTVLDGRHYHDGHTR